MDPQDVLGGATRSRSTRGAWRRPSIGSGRTCWIGSTCPSCITIRSAGSTSRRELLRAGVPACCLPPREKPSKLTMKVRIDRAAGVYHTRTLAGAGAGTDIVTSLATPDAAAHGRARGVPRAGPPREREEADRRGLRAALHAALGPGRGDDGAAGGDAPGPRAPPPRGRAARPPRARPRPRARTTPAASWSSGATACA